MHMVCGGCASVLCDGVHGDHPAVGWVVLAGWWTCVQMIHPGQWGAWHVVSDGVRLLQHWDDVCWGGDGPMGPHCYRMPGRGCQVYVHPDGG